MLRWFANIFDAVSTLLGALWVGMRYWILTYDPERRTYTEQYEYPELPAPVSPRYRGFHRFDMSACLACDRCARDCPVGCIHIEKEKNPTGKGFRITSFIVDYTQCMFCGLCTEGCPKNLSMGSTHDLSCYSREGCIVDFARIPREIASGVATLDPMAVTQSKAIVQPVNSRSSAGRSVPGEG